MSRIIYHPVIIALFSLIILVLCVSLYINSRQIKNSGQSLFALESDVKKISSDVHNTEEKLHTAQDPFTKEKLVRDSMLMQKPGEYIVQIPDLPSPTPITQATKQEFTPWQAWKKLLFE